MNFFGKSYNELESEINESKSKMQLLEEKIEDLMKKHVDMTKTLYGTNSKIQLLEEKLQKNTSSLISFTDNSVTKFIDINCSNITIVADVNGYSNTSSILVDDVVIQITSVIGISKLINELKNIRIISYQCRPHVDSHKPIPSVNKGYYLDIIKQIIKINNNVKLIMSFTYDFPYNWIKYILTDLPFENILEIEISYSSHIDRDNTDIIACLDYNKKIMFKNTYAKPV